MPIKSFIPLGTLDKCQSLGRNPAAYATCSAPGGSDSVGCSAYSKCPWRNRPQNLGVRIVKRGPNGAVTMKKMLPCYAALNLEEMLRDNKKGFVQVMAREGENFIITEKVKDPPNPAAPGTVTWSMGEVPVVIKPHPTFETVYQTNIELSKVQRMLEQAERDRDVLDIAGVDPGPLRIMEVKKPEPKASDERIEGVPGAGAGSGGSGSAAGPAPQPDSKLGRRS